MFYKMDLINRGFEINNENGFSTFEIEDIALYVKRNYILESIKEIDGKVLFYYRFSVSYRVRVCMENGKVKNVKKIK